MKRHVLISWLLTVLLLLPGCFGGRKDENVNKDLDRPVPEKPADKK